MIVNVYFWFSVSLYPFREGIPLTTVVASNFIGRELITALQKVISYCIFGCCLEIFDSYSSGKVIIRIHFYFKKKRERER